MTTELTALMGMVAIFFATIGLQGATTPIVHGFGWALGARDDEKARSVLQGRLKRVISNSSESLLMFMPVVLIAHLLEISTPLTQSAAMAYLVARAAYLVVYVAGIPVIRTLIWAVGLVATVIIAWAVVSQSM